MKWIVLATAVALVSSPAQAGYDCESSADDYKSALSSINSALKRYLSCLESSGGEDDCSFEFRRLRSAQDEFESAVSDIGTYCKN